MVIQNDQNKIKFFKIYSYLRAAAMTLRTVLLSLQALLAAAEPDDPQDAVVANQYKNNFKIFLQTAKHWANKYAGAPNLVVECDSKVKQLVDMGFEEVSLLTNK
jgi:ubiquitin-conjugating enzyme (huntingtin interacting protein 2)